MGSPYRIACERLVKGLLDKSLEAFLESARKDDTNFMTHLMIGKLYLYGVNGDINLLNVKKAEFHLRAAARDNERGLFVGRVRAGASQLRGCHCSA